MQLCELTHNWDMSLLHSDNESFWAGCGTPEKPCCINCDVLARTKRQYCVCTAMLYDPKDHVGEPFPVSDEIVEEMRKSLQETGNL